MQAVRRKAEQNNFTALQSPIEIPSLERKSSKLKFREAWNEQSGETLVDSSKETKEPPEGNDEDSSDESDEDDGRAPDELKMEVK